MLVDFNYGTQKPSPQTFLHKGSRSHNSRYRLTASHRPL